MSSLNKNERETTSQYSAPVYWSNSPIHCLRDGRQGLALATIPNPLFTSSAPCPTIGHHLLIVPSRCHPRDIVINPYGTIYIGLKLFKDPTNLFL